MTGFYMRRNIGLKNVKNNEAIFKCTLKLSSQLLILVPSDLRFFIPNPCKTSGTGLFKFTILLIGCSIFSISRFSCRLNSMKPFSSTLSLLFSVLYWLISFPSQHISHSSTSETNVSNFFLPIHQIASANLIQITSFV